MHVKAAALGMISGGSVARKFDRAKPGRSRRDKRHGASPCISTRSVGQERYDLVLTITDRDLQRVFEKDQEQRRREEALRIPIPLPDSGIPNKQTAMSRVGNPPL